MTRLSLALLVTALLFAACGGGGAGTTPEATFKSFQGTLKSQDWGALFDMLAEGARDEFRGDYEGLKEDPSEAEELGLKPEDVADLEFRDFFVKMMEYIMKEDSEKVEELSKAEFLGAEEKGDVAEVKYKVGDDEETMELKKVNGVWMITDIG